jgi:hypothetical protein
MSRTSAVSVSLPPTQQLLGRAVRQEIQDKVLRRLEHWIRERYGGLDVAREATERYELAAVRLPKRPEMHLGRKRGGER